MKNTVMMPIRSVKPYANNPRHNRDAVDKVAASLKEFGFRQPIVVDKDNVIIAGHTRLLAAKKLKMKEVPVLVADDLTEEQVRAYRLADNMTGSFSTWDDDLLTIELDSIEDIDMTEFGFNLDLEGPDEEPQEVEEDEAPEEVEERCKTGDLWQLGEHRLICGDSTDVNVIDRLLGGVKAELLLTDPPYGINVVTIDKKIDGAKPFGSQKGYLMSESARKKGKNKICDCNEYAPIIGYDTTDTARASYDVAITCSKNQIIFGGNYFTDFLAPSRCWIVWDKENTGNFADAELAWTSFDKGVKLYRYLWNGLCREGSRKVEGKTRVHPTQKPVGMLADILKDFSKENETILDMFGGSGSTLIACEQLNRKCYMSELDPHYCSVILQRWENLTGQKAELIESEEEDG